MSTPPVAVSHNAGSIGIFKKIGLLVSAIGPGLFLIGYNIGTGSITTMAAAGSRYGMSLFWALFLSCLFTYVMLVAYGQYTAVTGETAMIAYKKRLPFGKALAIYTIIGLVIGELSALAGIMGIITDLVHEWGLLVFGVELNQVVMALVIITGCYILLWVGKYSRFEAFLVILVIVMGASFLGSMLMVVPEPAEVLAGMVPGIPDEPNAFLIVAGIAGTTCSAMVFIMRSIVVAEKGWTAKNLRQGNIDAMVSAGMMMLLSVSVMIAAAGTLYKLGQPVEQTVDMVKTLEPIAGNFAISLMVTGIIGAGISTMFPIVLIAPWLIDDYRNKPRQIQSTRYRVLGGAGLLLALIVPVIGARPVWVMVASQAFQATLLPVITLPIIVLLNRRDPMGEYRAKPWLNIGLWATFVFAIITAYTGIVGLADTLKAMLG